MTDPNEPTLFVCEESLTPEQPNRHSAGITHSYWPWASNHGYRIITRLGLVSVTLAGLINAFQPEQSAAFESSLANIENSLSDPKKITLSIALLLSFLGMAGFFYHELCDTEQEISPQLKQSTSTLTYRSVPTLIGAISAVPIYFSWCPPSAGGQTMQQPIAIIAGICAMFFYRELYGTFTTLMLQKKDPLLAAQFLPKIDDELNARLVSIPTNNETVQETRQEQGKNTSALFWIALITLTLLTAAPQTILTRSMEPGFAWSFAFFNAAIESLFHASHIAALYPQGKQPWNRLSAANKAKTLFFSFSHGASALPALLDAIQKGNKTSIIINSISFFTDAGAAIPEAITHVQENIKTGEGGKKETDTATFH